MQSKLLRLHAYAYTHAPAHSRTRPHTQLSTHPPTHRVNFYDFTRRGANCRVVDLPGYGFAYATEERKQEWAGLMQDFIYSRPTLKRIYLLLDARHGVCSCASCVCVGVCVVSCLVRVSMLCLTVDAPFFQTGLVLVHPPPLLLHSQTRTYAHTFTARAHTHTHAPPLLLCLQASS